MTASARIGQTFDYLTRLHQGWLTETEEADLLARLDVPLPEGTMTAHAYLILNSFPGLAFSSREVADDLGISRQLARHACKSLVRRGVASMDDRTFPTVYWTGERQA